MLSIRSAFLITLSGLLSSFLLVWFLIPKDDFATGFKKSGYADYGNASFYAGLPNDSFRQTGNISNKVFFSYVLDHRGYAGVVFNGCCTDGLAKLVPGYSEIDIQQPSGGLFGSTPPSFNALAISNGALVPAVGGLPSRSEMVNTREIDTVYLFNPKGVALSKNKGASK